MSQSTAPLKVAELAVENLSFSYREKRVVENLSFRASAGELIALVGPNGCGKSTLLKLLIGALAPQSGTTKLDGERRNRFSTIHLAQRLAMVPQLVGSEGSFDESIGGAFLVEQVVLMSRYASHVAAMPGLLARIGGLGFETAEDLRLARESMWACDVHHLAERPVATLSGGERQRVLIARAFAQQTPILLLDEPTSALDLFHELELLEQLRAFTSAGKLVVLVTHDLQLAASAASRVLLMDQGKIVADGAPADVLTPAILEPVYHVKVRTTNGILQFERRSTEPRT